MRRRTDSLAVTSTNQSLPLRGVPSALTHATEERRTSGLRATLVHSWPRILVLLDRPLSPCIDAMTMRADDFRRMALAMKDAIESAHMGHPDFRVNGRIFATLHADLQWGMVKLTPDQQRAVIQEHPGVFVPENGAWGLQGCTAVRLDAVDEETLGEALTLAWRNAAMRPAARPKRAAPRSTRRRSPKR